MFISSEKKDLYFATLKLSVGMGANRMGCDFFEKRDCCDEFIKTLIYCVETKGLNLYGFVILSDQVHLIVNAQNGNINSDIEDLKQISSNEVIMHINRTIESHATSGNKDMVDLRRFFNLFLNNGNSQIWQDESHLTKLKLKSEDKMPEIISTDVLVAYLADRNRNYFQLGASAFTKLMMQTESI